MAIVGVLARIDTTLGDEVRRDLSSLPGVTPFDLDVPEKLGLVIEGDSVEAVHEMLHSQIETTDGVLGVWPVYVHLESASEEIDAGGPVSSVP